MPTILKKTPKEFFERTKNILSENAATAMNELEGVPGISPVRPNGAMYLMIGLNMDSFPEFENELEFAKALIAEESVYCLPGSIFSYPGSVRLVITYPAEKIREACQRLKGFCFRHYSSESLIKRRASINGYCPDGAEFKGKSR